MVIENTNGTHSVGTHKRRVNSARTKYVIMLVTLPKILSDSMIRVWLCTQCSYAMHVSTH